MDFHFSPNLFLEVAELNKFKESLDVKGFRKALLQNSESFGLIRTNKDIAFLNGRVDKGVTTSSGLKTIRINALEAINNEGFFLSSPLIDNILVPADGKWYWVKVVHKYDTAEEGVVSLAVNGDLVGENTKFTETLRGVPNFPSRIKFLNSENNFLEYDVLEVIDDTHAVVMHPAVNGTGIATFDVEDNLKYAVVGTFTAGVAIPQVDKYPFRYDSVAYTVEAELVVNKEPEYVEGQEFYLARVKIENGEIIIQDKRKDFWISQGKKYCASLDLSPNPLIGVEAVKWANPLSPANENQVYIAWGMRSQNWAVDSSQNLVTLFGSATGGLFRTVDEFVNGDFDGWRLYTQNGNYSRVVSSIKQGQAINLVLDVLNVDDYSVDGGLTFKNKNNSAEWLLVVPDCEEVEIKFATSNAKNVVRNFVFPVNTMVARCELEVFEDSKCTYNVQYRYKSYKNYSAFAQFPSNAVGYYAEESFDTVGELKASEDRKLIPYVASFTEPYITLTLSPSAYSTFVGLVYKGDKIGVNTITSFSNLQVYELKVKRDKRYQYITGDITLNSDLYIALSSEGAVEGNEFRLHFNCSSLNLNNKKILIVRNQETGNPVVIKEITQGDVYQMLNQDGGIIFTCVYSDTKKWSVTSQNYDLGQPFEGKLFVGDLSSCFDGAGLGKVRGYFGWKIFSEMAGRVPIGYGSGTDANGVTNSFEYRAEGGEYIHKLTKEEMPRHEHGIANLPKRRNGEGDRGTYDQMWEDYVQGAKTDAVGSDIPHNNIQPYRAVAYIVKLY